MEPFFFPARFSISAWKSSGGPENAAGDAADAQRAVHSDLREELGASTKQLEAVTGELAKAAALLRDREAEVEKLAGEKDEFVKRVAGEMELCVRELETLGEKLQEKNAQVEELRVALRGKERELEGGKRRQGESEHVITGQKKTNTKKKLFNVPAVI